MSLKLPKNTYEIYFVHAVFNKFNNFMTVYHSDRSALSIWLCNQTNVLFQQQFIKQNANKLTALLAVL